MRLTEKDFKEHPEIFSKCSCGLIVPKEQMFKTKKFKNQICKNCFMIESKDNTVFI